jgi:hypothetical protein
MRQVLVGIVWFAGALLALALLLLSFIAAFPLSLFLVGALLLVKYSENKRNMEKIWAKALAGTFKPVTIALLFLCLFLIVLTLGGATNVGTLVSWEDRIVMDLYKGLSWLNPSAWIYLLLLILATGISYKMTTWNVVSKLSQHKAWFGKLVSVVTLIASVTFLGEKAIVRPKMNEFEQRLEARYQNAKLHKENSTLNYVAAQTVTRALTRMDQNLQNSFRTYFQTTAKLNLDDTYDEDLGKSLALTEQPALTTLDLHSVPPSDLLADASKPAAEITAANPQEKIVAVQVEEKAAKDAALLETDGFVGLKKIASEVLGQGSDAAFKAASPYLNHLVSLLAAQYAAVLIPLVDDMIEPYANKIVGVYLDKLVDTAATKVAWHGIPVGSEAFVMGAANSDVAKLANRNLQAAAASAELLSREVEATQDLNTLKDLSAKASIAQKQADEAVSVLHASAAAPGAHVVDLAAQNATAEAARLATAEIARMANKAATEAMARAAEKAATKGIVREGAEALEHL